MDHRDFCKITSIIKPSALHNTACVFAKLAHGYCTMALRRAGCKAAWTLTAASRRTGTAHSAKALPRAMRALSSATGSMRPSLACAASASPESEPPRARSRPRLWSAAVHKPLTRANALVDEALVHLKESPPGQVSPVLWDVCIDAVAAIHSAPSKQLVRPQLVFLGGSWDASVESSFGDADVPPRGDAGSDGALEDGPVQRALEKFAAGLELQHLFMMVHDDVIDNATRRRGLPPVHLAARVNGRASGIRQQASYHLATIVGDVLYTQAIKLMHEASCEVGAPEALTTVLSDGVRTGFGQFCDIVGWGELQATGLNGRPAMDAADSILLDKSGRAATCSPLLAGMHLAGADSGTMAIAEAWARHAGVALQAIDDVADLVVEQATTGKDSFQDFRDQRLTVLLFLLWDRAGHTADWREVTALWRGLSPTRGSGDYSALLPHERRSLMHMLERHGVIPAAFDFARQHLDAAEEQLQALPDATLRVGLGRFVHGMRAHATALQGIIAEEAEEHGYLPT